MANETYLKPYDVSLGAQEIKKVDRIDAAEAATGRALYGDAAIWPTSNRRNLRNARVVVTTRDHASWDSVHVGDTGSLAFKVKVEKTGTPVSKTFSNLIVVDKSGAFGGDVETAQIVLEVEDSGGVTGPWS